MTETILPGFHLAGLKLKGKTTNSNSVSNVDCGGLWKKFEEGNAAGRIEGRLSDDIYAVYFDYEGDHTQPFAYFIGCKVKDESGVPTEMEHLFIPENSYREFIAKGIMPDCIADKWREIWSSDLKRAHHFDFEIYDDRSRNWNDATVHIYVSGAL